MSVEVSDEFFSHGTVKSLPPFPGLLEALSKFAEYPTYNAPSGALRPLCHLGGDG